MTNQHRFRFFSVLLVLFLMCSPLFGQRFRSQPRRVERQPAASAGQPQPSPTAPVRIPAPADAMGQLHKLAGEIKANPRALSATDVSRCQKLLLDAVNDLQRRMPREFDKASASEWSATFRLAELKATLGKKTPDTAIIEAVHNVFSADKEGLNWVVFDGLRTALRRYQTVSRLFSAEDYKERLSGMCDKLLEYIDTYKDIDSHKDNEHKALSFVLVSEAVMWLEAVSIVEPRAARLAELTKTVCAGVNVRLHAGSDFVVAGFNSDIDEQLEINETILGTKVVGSGTISGKSYAELATSPNRGTIKVLAEALLDTRTDGSQAMVTLKNHTSGMLRGEKQIVISADAVTTVPAKAKASLQSDVSDVKINGGQLVQRVARGQIESRKRESQAEAARRAEKRMSVQMNERIDPNIAKLNTKYQKARESLNKVDLFPRIWNLSTNAEQIDWAIQLGNRYQPAAPALAPALQSSNGLVVQVHQSALNNMLASTLAGRSIDEERFSERLSEFFDEIPEFLQRKPDENPAKVLFLPRAPVNVLFVDDKISVVVRLDGIQVMDNATRSFTISVEYKVKREDGKIILEQTKAEALPTGYKPDSGTTLSTTQTVIRSYLMRRLGALQKQYEMEPVELKGEWEGRGRLIPQFASTEQGWLSLVWSWE